MNVFVLCTGRCGSTTLVEACHHIDNYTAAHESRSHLIGESHFSYEENHIEADNRLAWFLGRLDRTYGDSAFYVHLKRDLKPTAKSYARRQQFGIIHAYRQGMLMGYDKSIDPVELAEDYCKTVTANIDLFLRDKTNKMDFRLEHAKEDFAVFWDKIGATGDLEAALSAFETNFNSSPKAQYKGGKSWPHRFVLKVGRAAAQLPEFVKNV